MNAVLAPGGVKRTRQRDKETGENGGKHPLSSTAVFYLPRLVGGRGCFAWLSEWSCAPTHTVAWVMELYEQLLPMRVYVAYKMGTSDGNNVMCRMCEKPQNVLCTC